MKGRNHSGDIPDLLFVAAGLAFYNTFVLIEEFVIDRYDLGEYLPFYTPGHFCEWDITALLIISTGVFWYRQSRKKQEGISQPASK